jgi:hypothetical protein
MVLTEDYREYVDEEWNKMESDILPSYSSEGED